MSEMPEWVRKEIIKTILEKWSGKDITYKENDLKKTPGLYEAFFCEDNQYEAAKEVLKYIFATFATSQGSKQEFIRLAEQLCANGLLSP